MLLGLPAGADVSEPVAHSREKGQRRNFVGELRARGADLQLVYTGEFAAVRGGERNGHVYLDNVDLMLELDLERLVGDRDASLFLYVLGNSGGSATRYAGDLQVLSNIDAPDTWKIYEFWYRKSWLEDRFSLKTGLYDFNSEFDVIDTASLFINSSFGIGPDISQSGENGPSIFPTTSLAARLRFESAAGAYVQGAVLDGVPGDPGRPNGTRVHLRRDDGLLLGLEAGYQRDATEPGAAGRMKFALGTWRYTAAVDTDVLGGVASGRENRGAYVLVEASLLREPGDCAQGLSGFLRHGIADKRLNPLDSYAGGGLVYTGLFPHRDQDRLGIAFAHARSSHAQREAMRALGEAPAAAETVIELSYRLQLRSWLALQPDYQYVKNPGLRRDADDAHVLSLRLEIAL